ncbi:MAG: anion permease [Verrucomicrobia bacterium]|nr:MAG: anion permease [Verrucomicrobiota bacterium]
MAWSIGANDVANAMGTSVGSGGLTLKQAVLVAAVMEFAGAVFVGSHVSETVRSGIFDPSRFEALTLVLGFLSALLAAAVWLQVATWFGWPVSTTHSIVGSLVGIGVVLGGVGAVQWGRIGEIVASWVVSPLCGGVVAFALMKLIHRLIIDHKHPLAQTYRLVPWLTFYVAFVLSLVMVWKGLKNLHLNLPLGKALVVATLSGLAGAALAVAWTRRLRRLHDEERRTRGVELEGDVPDGIPFVPKEYRSAPEPKVVLRPPLAPGSELPAKRWEYRREFEFEKTESVFAAMMIASACFLAFAHGANDVANAIGPLAAVVAIVREGVVALKAAVPVWTLLLGGVGIVIGLATWGYKVIETIGRKITHLTPSRGFAANLGAATTIVAASRMGLPISTTHTLVGAVLGVGLARGIEYLNLRMVRDIVISWLVTIPAGALLAVLFFYLLRLPFPG